MSIPLRFKVNSNKDFLLEAIIIIMILGFVYSKALITFSIASLSVLSLGQISYDSISGFFRNGPYRWLLLVFLAYLLSVFNSEDIYSWIDHVKLKLPFLVLPITFYLLRPISVQVIYRLILWLLIVILFSSLPVFLQTVVNWNAYAELISKGQSLNTPIEHVKYSMMVAFSMSAALYVVLAPKPSPYVRMNIMLLIGVLWLFIFLHILAVRTGLVIAYASVGVLIWMVGIKKKSRKVTAYLSAVVILFPLFAYQTFPSFRAKIGYMIYDWKEGSSGYSDSERVITAKAGWKVFSQFPVFGSGIGDLKKECVNYYQNQLSLYELNKYPHSQFLYVLAGCGVIGFLLFFIGLYVPLLLNFKSKLLVLIYLNYSLSFLVENSLERSFSTAFFLCFTLLAVSSKETV